MSAGGSQSERVSEDGSTGREALAPPRPGVRHVRIIILSRVIIADDDLRRRVDRFFHWPMMILALLMLPVLVVEFIHKQSGTTGTVLWWFGIIAMTVIWLAFFVEFVVKIAIAESRPEYARRNWLDILIIIIPFLRPLRVAYVARTTRIFTMRGVGMKLLRYVFTVVVGLEATDRMLQRIGIKSKVDRKDPLEMTRYQLMDEVKKLRRLADAWEDWYDAQQMYLKEQVGVEIYDEPIPDFQTPTDSDDKETGEEGHGECGTAVPGRADGQL